MSDDELARIWAEVARLPKNSAAAVALLEEGARIADSRGDRQAGWDLRDALMSRVYHTGDWDKLLVHFGWSIAQHDREPERFPAEDVLWKYKWVVNEAARMPQIARPRLIALLGDMEQRFRAAGSSMRAVHQHRAVVMAKLGELDAARAAMGEWTACARDWLSDCVACEPDSRAELLAESGDEAGALAACEELLKSRAGCAEVPHRTHARMLAPLRARGDFERAMHHHRAGDPLSRPLAKLVEAHAQHLDFAAAEGLDDEAIGILDRHLAGAMAHPTAWERMIFWTAAARALSSLAERGRDRVPLRVPEDAGVDRDATTEALAAWARRNASDIAAAFDRRNGNAHVSTWIASFGA